MTERTREEVIAALRHAKHSAPKALEIAIAAERGDAFSTAWVDVCLKNQAQDQEATT